MSLFSKLTKNHVDKGSAYPWSQRKLGGASSLLPRHGHAATALPLEESILIFGGIHSKPKKDLFFIDTNNMSTTSICTTGDVPSPRLFPVMAPMSVNSLVLLYGGEPSVPGEKWDPHFYVLNTNTRQWSRIQMVNDSLPVERSGHCIAAAGSCLYIWGGQRAGRYLDDMFVFNTNTFPVAPRWEHVASNNRGPAGRSGHVSAIFENKLYIFGGTDGDHLYNDIWCYDLHSRYWMQVPAIGFIPIPREGCASALVDDVLYVFGGRGPDGQDLGDLCAFKFRGQRWYRFQNMGPGPSPRHELTFTAVGERIVSVGGEASSGRLDEHAVYILDTAKISYPPEQPPSQQEPVQTHPQQREPSPAATVESDTLRNPSPTPSPQKPSHVGQAQRESPVPRTGSPPVVRESNPPSPQNTSRHRSLYPDAAAPSNPSATSPSRPPRHMSMIPEAALKRPRANSPLANSSEDTSTRRQAQPETNSAVVDANATVRTLSPTHPELDGSVPGNNHLPSSLQAPLSSPVSQRPPRPPRESNNANLRQTIAVSMYQTARPDLQQHLQVDTTKRSFSPQSQPSPADTLTSDVDPGELEALVREIRAKEAIISNMKKMEPWWRSEVSIARRMRVARNEDEQRGADADETLLMDMSDNINFELFEKLISFKSEVRRVKAAIQGNAAHEAMEEKIKQSDRMRTASLQEAAYFKSKLLALETSGPVHPSSQHTLNLEEKLAAVLADNENRKRQLQQLNKSAQHDHAAREAAEERAREAQDRAQEAQHAHERALQDLEHFYERATHAESQVKENTLKMADLQAQLADALSASTPSTEISDARQKITQLEGANQHVQAETRDLQEQLGSCAQDIEHLYDALKEREDALSSISKQIQDTTHQLYIMKEIMSEKGLTPTTPAPGTTTTTSAY